MIKDFERSGRNMIPQVKNGTFTGKTCRFPLALSITAEEFGGKAADLLALFVPLCSCTYKEKGGIIAAEKATRYENKPEHYTLTVHAGGVKIEYGAYLGFRKALSCFSMLLRVSENAFAAQECRIEDYPDADYRGVMLDLAWGCMNFETLKNDVVMIGRARMKYLHLHLSDSIGVCFQAESLPQEMYIPNAYSKEQMRQLNRLAELVGVQIVPEFDMPAHAKKLLSVYPALKCVVTGPRRDRTNHWAVCAGAEETYVLLERVIREILELFPGKYFHMGGDELEFADFPNAKDLCFYDDCERCSALKAREGLSDKLDVYNYFVKRIHKIVSDAGRTLVMWSDQLDCTRSAPLPKDILMQFWRVAAKDRGPHENCSMNGQLAMGYKLINSYYNETYCESEYGFKPKQFQYWDWRREPTCSPAYTSQLLGSELCAWGYGETAGHGHFSWTLPSYVYLMADKLWSGEFRAYDETYSKMLTQTVLGPGTPEDLDIFYCYGDLVPPKGDVRIAAISTQASAGEIFEAIRLLKNETQCAAGDAARAANYLRVMEKLYHWYDPAYLCAD